MEILTSYCYFATVLERFHFLFLAEEIMKGVILLGYYNTFLSSLESQWAMEGVEQFLRHENAPCYAILDEEAECDNVCCDYTVLIINNLDELFKSKVNHFRLNIFVNLNDSKGNVHFMKRNIN